VVIDNPKYVTEETYEEWLTRGVPEPGDLLITTEAPPGDTALFPDDQRYLPTRRIITFKTVGVDNRYLQLCFNNSRVEEYIAHNSRGTTVDRILKDTLFETPIPLPPQSEQEKIVSEVERNNTVIKNGMETIKDVLHRAENMKQSILAKAFHGELVQPSKEDIKHKHNSTEPTAQTEQITLQDLDNV
jgi:type I restriction enzyme S subunit